jgi:hypothetical protein
VSDDVVDVVLDYQGRRVAIEAAWWSTHVVTPRPKMASHLHEVHATIAAPAFVNRDKDFPDRHCLYGTYTSISSPRRLMLKVVVEYVEYDEIGGRLITAYPCSRPGSSAVRLWTSPRS